MNKKEELSDRLMDELLREDARGEAGDEKLLAAVQAEITGEIEDGKVTRIRTRNSRAPYAWAAALTVSAASVIGYLGWRASVESSALEDLAMGPEMESQLEPARSPGTRGVPKKSPIGRYRSLWSKSPHTVPPPHAAEETVMGNIVPADPIASRGEGKARHPGDVAGGVPGTPMEQSEGQVVSMSLESEADSQSKPGGASGPAPAREAEDLGGFFGRRDEASQKAVSDSDIYSEIPGNRHAPPVVFRTGEADTR